MSQLSILMKRREELKKKRKSICNSAVENVQRTLKTLLSKEKKGEILFIRVRRLENH